VDSSNRTPEKKNRQGAYVVEWLREHQNSPVHTTREAQEQQVLSSEETKAWTMHQNSPVSHQIEPLKQILPIMVDNG
jgi:hypothetical protein